ncbi:MAG: ABC transporter permease [Christensenellales bacterium]
MLKTLAAQIKQYKKSTILTPIFAALEVVMEVLIPMAMARLVKYGIEGGDTGAIYRYGFLMMAMAMLSLVFGSVCAHTASHASTGFAANLRDGMYRNIQRFSFANIDKYSTAGLVTRMTTDVTNVQNAFQMITRIAVRSPLTLIFSMIAAFVINPELAGVFLIPLVLLGVVLGLIIKRATHLFDQVFKKYDDLNASVQENVSGIRVVKAFVREDFEDKKFGKAATNVYNLFVKAERIIAFNSPVMMLTIYGSVMALSWLGASLVTGGSLDVGRPDRHVHLRHEHADESDDAVDDFRHADHVRSVCPAYRGSAERGAVAVEPRTAAGNGQGRFYRLQPRHVQVPC